jgi:hypothetical protein
MIKLNAQKSNTVKFEIDVSNGEENLKGHFRLVHENVEYGFPVHIFGNENKAQVVIPALEKIIPNLKKTAVLEARLEFTGNGDYICAWDSKAKIEIPRIQVNVKEDVDIKVSEEETGIVIETKVTAVKTDKENNFSVSDEAWEDAKKNSKKILL